VGGLGWPPRSPFQVAERSDPFQMIIEVLIIVALFVALAKGLMFNDYEME
jgi:hypothetical protein